MAAEDEILLSDTMTKDEMGAALEACRQRIQELLVDVRNIDKYDESFTNIFNFLGERTELVEGERIEYALLRVLEKHEAELRAWSALERDGITLKGRCKVDREALMKVAKEKKRNMDPAGGSPAGRGEGENPSGVPKTAAWAIDQIRSSVNGDHMLSTPRSKEFEAGKTWSLRRLNLTLDDLNLQIEED